MMDFPIVAVLMSTYNGEKYICEQLDSIFGQKYVHVRLYVRDDGSTDNTVEILKEYEKQYPIELFYDGENVGPGESFMRLVYKYADAPGIDFYAFADQDDIWLEDKLSVAVTSISESKNDEPVLYSSNQFLYMYGKNLGVRHKDPQNVELIPHMTRNTIAGCTFVFNKVLAKLVADADRPDSRITKYRMHDAWLMLVAICCGHVIYDKESHMLYRIHEDNMVGVKKYTIAEIVTRMINLFSRKGNSNLRMITAQELLRLFKENISNYDKATLSLYAEYKIDLERRYELFSNKQIISNCLEKPMIFKLKVILGYV